MEPNFPEEEEIDVRLKIKKIVSLKVKKNDTIKSLKELLCEKEGVSEDIQDIFFAGNRLKDDKRLIEYGIQQNSTLRLTVPNVFVLKLYVEIPSSDTIITVNPMIHHTVHTVKSLIKERVAIEPDQFALVCDGKVLEDDMTLVSLGVKNESTLYLILCSKNVVSIFVKMPNWGIVKLEVQISFTVHDVMALVGSMTSVVISNQVLIYGGKQLDDCKTMAFYDVKEGSTLEMHPSVLRVFVKTPSEEIVKLKMKVLFTVNDVKSIISKMTGVSFEDQALVYEGKWLEGSSTLAFYNLKEDSILEVLHFFQIFVRTCDGKTLILDVQPSNTISDVKNKLFDKLNIAPAPAPVKIVYAGKYLEDDNDLASYDIQKDSTLNMRLCLSHRQFKYI